MTVRGALARGRARHALLMVEVCEVKRETGTTMDSDDKITPTFTDVTPVSPTFPDRPGMCRIKAFRTGHQTESGQVAVLKRGYDVEMPWDAQGALERGDVLTMTVSDDAWVVGRPLTVIEVNYAGTQTARHIMVEDRS